VAALQPGLQLGRGPGRGGRVVEQRRILPQHPGGVAVGLEALHKGLHGDLHHVLAAGALQRRQDGTIMSDY